MEGDLDPFEYDLAALLGMTVEEMQDRMTHHEYLRWRALFVYRAAMRELEKK